MKKFMLLILIGILSGCGPMNISSLGSGTTMSRIQIPGIFIQQGGSNSNYGYGVNVQCPPGRITDCVGGGLFGSITRQRIN